MNPAPRCGGGETGNVTPLLNEVMHALERLQAHAEETVIDLLGVPLAPGETRQLDAALGRGEIRIELDALGPSTLQESAFPGVWLVSHHNANGELIGRFIEIARVPALLTAPAGDIDDGLERLRALLRAARYGDQDDVRDTG